MFGLAQLILWLGIPLLVAAMIAHLVRLPHFTVRIAVVVYAVALGVAGLVPPSESVKLGIDLSGGTILVYQVAEPVPSDFEIDKLVTAINRRVNPAGLMDVTVRAVGDSRVEIIIPRASQEEVERSKRVLTNVGSLEFRILANQRDNAPLMELAQATFPKPVVQRGRTLARWVPLAESAGPLAPGGGIAVRSDRERGTRVLVAIDEFNVTGELLSRAESTVDEMGRPAVAFHFGARGARLFGGLTEINRPDSDGFERRLAILLNDQVYSAPALRERITDSGIITGQFTEEEVKDLVGVLNAGSLPAALQPSPASELTIGPTLGRDTIQSGLTAMVIATAVVLLFMAAYYRLAGLIADLAVLLNVLIVAGAMAWISAAWTLPGLAGLALTVGMAVDANVLIFERLREEQQAGRSLRLAIENAFSQAFRPILDSNVTTLLAAAVLYTVGSEQVKGFAVTLILGLLANLFTAVFVCRVMIDVLEKNRWVKRFGMTQILRQPSFDFVGKRFVALAGSGLVIVAGLVALALRGADLLDIDFTGGTLAAIRLEEPSDSATVRALATEVLPDVGIEELQISGEPPGHCFLIRTTMQDQQQVKQQISQRFADLLADGSTFDRLDNFGAQVAGHTQTIAGLAMLASMAVIVAYLWIRFQNVLFGLGAVVALMHDVLVVLGLVALSHWLAGGPMGSALLLEDFKINLPMVAAFLTLVGYSVNDTIVVFDRIRQLRVRGEEITWGLINKATNQTLSRTLLTGFTTWVVAVILYVFGGTAIHGFAFCLLAGVIVGTYSSIYIASPILIWLRRQAPDLPTAGKPALPASDRSGQSPHHKQPQPARRSSKRRKPKAA